MEINFVGHCHSNWTESEMILLNFSLISLFNLEQNVSCFASILFLNNIIFSLINHFLYHLIVRGCRPGKSVHMTESEVRGLCLKSREIFLQQPILLELEAPLKICGM